MLLLACWASPALADGDKQACVTAHSSSQELRKAAKLKEASDQLVACARPECPSAVRADCAKWLGEVQSEVPSVVIVATDANGGDVADVRVLVDGSQVASELTGQPIALNPGKHTLRFERDGANPVLRQLLLRVGERNRRVEVQFSPTLAGGGGGDERRPAQGDSGPAEPAGAGVPAATWVLGGVGVLGLAGFTYFALDGRKKEDDLAACKPNCASDDVSAVRTSYLLGDVSLGVGVVALAGAAYFLFTAPSKPAAGRAAPLFFDLRASSRSAGGTLTGRF
ncbi:MAG: hypothetical protein HYZ29_16860 [Myxococcales bacterium]|nr:hypothetical protein [Myxococcales bacterium]